MCQLYKNVFIFSLTFVSLKYLFWFSKKMNVSSTSWIPTFRFLDWGECITTVRQAPGSQLRHNPIYLNGWCLDFLRPQHRASRPWHVNMPIPMMMSAMMKCISRGQRKWHHHASRIQKWVLPGDSGGLDAYTILHEMLPVWPLCYVRLF